MAGKTNLSESQIESVARWVSCNGEVWGIGPTAVFASAACLFLYTELRQTLGPGRPSPLETTLLSTMVLGMLALMVHLWVCSMRFFQYYLDILIKDSPSALLEMTTAGLLGPRSQVVPVGPLTKFLKQQQPQVHITVCWFLSLCYADYVRKNYCQRFNMPYLEQWQAELHARASQGMRNTVRRVHSIISALQARLGYTPPSSPPPANNTPTGVTERRLGASTSEPGLGPLPARLLCRAGHSCNYDLDNLRAYILDTRCHCGPRNRSDCTLCPPNPS